MVISLSDANARMRLDRDLDLITRQVRRMAQGPADEPQTIKYLRGFAQGAWSALIEQLPRVEQELITLEQKQRADVQA